MKLTNFRQLVAAGLFAVGTMPQSIFADGPSELEALAAKARDAAASDTKPPQKVAPPVVEKVAEKQAQPVAQKEVKVDLVKRAEKLGLISNVSKDVAAVMNFTNGERIWGEVEESEFGSVLLEVFAENDVDLTDPDSPGAVAASLFAEEFLLVVGKGTAQQVENLTSLSNLNDKYQIALMIELWTSSLEEEDDFMMESGPFASLLEGIKKNPDFFVNLVAALEMPPVLMAARVSDAEKREELAAALEMGTETALQMADFQELTFVSGIEEEISGVSFSGLEIDGEQLMETLNEEMGLQENLAEYFKPAGAEDLVNSLKEKNLVLAGAVTEEAVYFYLGSDTASIPLVDKKAESLAATDGMAFVDPYLDKNLVNVLWMDEKLVKASVLSESVLKNYIDGIRLGLEGNAALGNTKKFKELLTKIEVLEKSYLAIYKHQAIASVSYLAGDGLHTEAYGGLIEGTYDWEAQHKLGSDAGNSFLSFQGVIDSNANKVEMEYLEAIIEAFYEGATLLSGLEETPADFDDFKEGFLLFDGKLKTDALALWKSLSATQEGLENEFLFEVDLAGSLPTVPGLTEEVVANGPAPRISYVAPVADRSKLADSWKGMESSITELLKTVSEEVGENIPMQKPMSSQNDGLKTWFFPIPMQTDDFVPSVTLDDDVMIMSTSKERAIALAALSKKEASELTGIVTQLQFDPLREFLSGWLGLISEDPEGVLSDEEMIEFFEENEETIKALVDSLQEFDSLRVHTRVEDGQLRSTSHFKTK